MIPDKPSPDDKTHEPSPWPLALTKLNKVRTQTHLKSYAPNGYKEGNSIVECVQVITPQTLKIKLTPKIYIYIYIIYIYIFMCLQSSSKSPHLGSQPCIKVSGLIFDFMSNWKFEFCFLLVLKEKLWIFLGFTKSHEDVTQWQMEVK